MRVLVECRDCKRRYNASRLKIGAKFHCQCGQVLTVNAPKGHDAAVVRCSSCGGFREDGSQRCAFCKADFTIHERDLHTVCPGCLARVSDRAKFCSRCGSALSADVLAGDVSKLMCPQCDQKVPLTNRFISEAQVSFLECRMCAGLWMESEGFAKLRRKHKALGDLDESIGRVPRLKQDLRGSENKVRYRKCPVCHKLMNRRLYGTGSGVVLDWCREHGMWFDDGELRQILEWIRQGGRSDRPIGVPHQKAKTLSAADCRTIYGSTSSSPASFLDNIFGSLQNAIDDLFDF